MQEFNAPPKWNRLRLSQSVTYRLRNLKGKVGLTPNLLCRIGFCMSLAEPRIPNPETYDEDGPELNRSTLLGEWEQLFEALLRERIVRDGLDPVEDYVPQLRAHMNRGAELVCNRVRSLPDILDLVPRS